MLLQMAELSPALAEIDIHKAMAKARDREKYLRGLGVTNVPKGKTDRDKYAEILAIAKQRRDDAAKRINLQSYKLQKESHMSYNVLIPGRDVNVIYGTAYDNLYLKNEQRMKIVKTLLEHHCNSHARHSPLNVYRDDSNPLDYMVDCGFSGRLAYNAATQVEEYFQHQRRRPISAVVQWGRSLFRGKRPVVTFMLDYDILPEVVEWLGTNVRPSDYQIHSKYGSDISLGFANGEHAALFKLTFGEKDI